MRKVILPFVALIVCVASVTAIRAISATISSPMAVSQPGNIYSCSLIQAGDYILRAANQAGTLTFAERVKYQRAIEDVYWRHRLWPKENATPKPTLNQVMSQAQIENKVQDYLRNSQALEAYWQRPITPKQLQAEMDRMAEHTREPEVLRELFDALGNDPFVIAECLARPTLMERLSVNWSSYDQGIHGELVQRMEADLRVSPKAVAWENETLERFVAEADNRLPSTTMAPSGGYMLPKVADVGGCVDDSWTVTSITNAPTGRVGHTAVWTGTEMIVWGGDTFGGNLNTGGRYNPATDTWMATSTINAPRARSGHTAVWTGTEMIVWGGFDATNRFNTGGRYNPATNNWRATSTTNAPSGRYNHTAIWTGSKMIVWGGASLLPFGSDLNTGGRYNPSTDTWTATNTANAPISRAGHTAVWTGSNMIVWGGHRVEGGFHYLNTGGRYNLNTNSWTATTIANAPSARDNHTTVWTGNEMVVWGGFGGFGGLRTGGKYDPATNRWTPTSTTNAPSARVYHTAVWTGNEMIVWGGYGADYLDTGGRYDPSLDSWTATSTTNAPDGRYSPTAVWTGTQMIVWGGSNDNNNFATGSRYCAAATRLGNISTRAFVQTGDNVMIGGLIVQGSEPKRVIIRAIGPELTGFGVPNVLADPTLELHNSSGALIASNDSWLHTILGGIITADQVRDIRNSGHTPTDAKESAIIADLSAGNYTMVVRGVDNTTGVALVEAYDLSPETNSILGNISTRSFVQTDDNVMIGGFIVQGTQPKRVIVRGIGPELGAPPYNIPNALANPTLELHNEAGALIASNDNWRQTIIVGIIMSDQVHDIMGSGHAPTDGRESAVIATLEPGNYTAIVRGVNNTTGVALVEVYDLD